MTMKSDAYFRLQRLKQTERYAQESTLNSRKLQVYYMLVVNGMRNINQIASWVQTDYETVVRYLEKLIKQANSKIKLPSYEWKAFIGAYIDYEQNKIVLSHPIDKLIIYSGTIKKIHTVAVNLLGIFTILLSLLGFIGKAINPNDESMSLGLTIFLFVFIFPWSLFCFFGGYFTITKPRKQLEKFYDLIENQKITSICQLAKKTNQSESDVIKTLEKLIYSGQFVNAEIDLIR